MTFDRRVWPVNDQVVARWLADRFPDRTPVDPKLAYVSVPVLDLSLSPGGSRDRQLLYGWAFEILEQRNGCAFGICPNIDYVGWVRADALVPEGTRGEATSWVGSRQTHAFASPDMKSHEQAALSFASLLVSGSTQNRFTQTELGWVPSSHLVQSLPDDPVAVADLFLGTPYLWGGNSAFGIDCSGLVQAALTAVGQTCPADSDLQAAALGRTLDPGAAFQRGDLLFWKGHVALVADADTLIHANAYHMAVTYEPITQAITRIQSQGDGPVTRHARLD